VAVVTDLLLFLGLSIQVPGLFLKVLSHQFLRYPFEFIIQEHPAFEANQETGVNEYIPVFWCLMPSHLISIYYLASHNTPEDVSFHYYHPGKLRSCSKQTYPFWWRYKECHKLSFTKS
jgi:hypothetical protein